MIPIPKDVFAKKTLVRKKGCVLDDSDWLGGSGSDLKVLFFNKINALKFL